VGRCLLVSEKWEGARYFGRFPKKVDVLGVSFPDERPFNFDKASMTEAETRDTFTKDILKYTRGRILFANPFAQQLECVGKRGGIISLLDANFETLKTLKGLFYIEQTPSQHVDTLSIVKKAKRIEESRRYRARVFTA
jgi:hypothetical protein